MTSSRFCDISDRNSVSMNLADAGYMAVSVSVSVYVDALRGGKVGVPTGILPHVRGWRSW